MRSWRAREVAAAARVRAVGREEPDRRSDRRRADGRPPSAAIVAPAGQPRRARRRRRLGCSATGVDRAARDVDARIRANVAEVVVPPAAADHGDARAHPATRPGLRRRRAGWSGAGRPRSSRRRPTAAARARRRPRRRCTGSRAGRRTSSRSPGACPGPGSGSRRRARSSAFRSVARDDEMTASRRPSGDQATSSTPRGRSVSRRASPGRSRGRRWTWVTSSRSLGASGSSSTTERRSERKASGPPVRREPRRRRRASPRASGAPAIPPPCRPRRAARARSPCGSRRGPARRAGAVQTSDRPSGDDPRIRRDPDPVEVLGARGTAICRRQGKRSLASRGIGRRPGV